MSMERLPPRMIQYQRWWGKDEELIRIIIDDPGYQACRTYREQCHKLYRLGRGYFLSKNFMARLLGVDHKSFEKQISLPLEERPVGRPSILNETEKAEIINDITALIENNCYPTIKDIHQLITEKFQKILSIDTVRRFIDSSEHFKIVHGEPMEELRANVDRGAIDEYFTRLANAINGVPISLIFNIDEAGEDDYIDTNAYLVVVKHDYASDRISIPVRRESKRSTLVHCICADGSYTKPLIIIPRKTIDSCFLKRICCSNVLIKTQEKGFANTELIKFWLENIFFPVVAQKLDEERKRSGYQGNAVLILDGFSCHRKALESFNLEERHVTVVFLVPHSSHLTQPLDLVIFFAQKKYTTTMRSMNGLSSQADCLRRIIHGLQQASTTENIVSAFESAGIVRTYNKRSVNEFNNSMPLARVAKGYSRYFKDDSFTYAIDNWHIPI